MTKTKLLDTDILIDYLRGYHQAITFLEKCESHLLISVISVAELYAGVKENEEREILQQFLRLFTVMDVTAKVATQGGLYRRDYGSKYGTGLADALIAATAKLYDAQLVTLNKRHFSMLDNILVPYTK